MKPLLSTARLQLHKAFTLDDAAAQVPYLANLGISHVYASPILTARAGSMHGYDVISPAAVNPELGGEDALRRLVATLRRYDMGLIVDIVPNHMAVGEADNPWWQDVLEWGLDSPYAHFFDIDWAVPDPALYEKLLAPFLGKPYGEALAEGEIELKFDVVTGRIHAEYFSHHFPIAAADYPAILRNGGDAVAELATGFIQATHGVRAARRRQFERQALLLADAAAAPAVAAAITRALATYSAKTAVGVTRLHRLLERQHYRLAFWRTAADEINWRRFFDVISLAGLRTEDPAVFEAVHATTFRLYAEGLIDGLRVDHVDGLADPRAYCLKLRNRLTALIPQRPATVADIEPYIVVEKILAATERLRTDWRTDGTTGYSFMNECNAVLHDPDGAAPLKKLWTELSGRSGDFDAEERRARRRIVDELLGADFTTVARLLHRIARSETATRDVTFAAIRRVLLEFLVHFPVYRIYADRRGRAAAGEAIMASVREAAKLSCRAAEGGLVDIIDRWLGGEAPVKLKTVAARRLRLRTIARFQQLSSPVAAKSVEDTAFYRHGELLSRNEVGADPGRFSMSLDEFNSECERRQRLFPLALLATATHDHKRGEDVRARLAVLSEIPDVWSRAVLHWFGLNAAARGTANQAPAPSPADEYMLYQMIVGAWPPDLRANDAHGLQRYAGRLAAWQQKALREAKLATGWSEPNLPYEDACLAFLEAILDPVRSAAFLEHCLAFVDSIAPAAAINGLTQTILKMTAPGVPDLYQGCEFWDFSLVDPDNRRPVDYHARAASLESGESPTSLLPYWRNGRIKQAVIARTLALRARHPDLFPHGRYLPLRVRGQAARHLIAFARINRARSVIVVATRFPAGMMKGLALPLVAAEHWRQTCVHLPAELQQGEWSDVLGGPSAGLNASLSKGRLKVGDVLAYLPLAVLEQRPTA